MDVEPYVSTNDQRLARCTRDHSSFKTDRKIFICGNPFQVKSTKNEDNVDSICVKCFKVNIKNLVPWTLHASFLIAIMYNMARFIILQI